MRGLYVIWPDFQYIDEAVKAGIDTLLVCFYSHSWAPAPSAFDSWATSVSVLERYKGQVRLIACPIVMERWMPVDEGHRFVSGGKEYPFVFCPTSQEWMGKIFSPFKDLQAKGLCDGIIYDVENYVGGPRLFQEQIRCECSRCALLSVEDQWKQRSHVMLRDGFNQGQLIYSSWWSLQCYPNALCLTEDTYADMGRCDSFKLRRRLGKEQKKAEKERGFHYTLVPGLFIEVFKSLDQFLKQLKYLSTHYPYEGYWIYSQKIFSRISRMSEEEMKKLEGGFGYYERRLIDQVDGNFFNKLKELNK
jgi:hypothetical protein